MSSELLILAADVCIDGSGRFSEVLVEARRRLDESRAGVADYRLAPLSFGWNSPLPAGYLKSACAPIEALIEGKRRIAAGELDAVVPTRTTQTERHRGR